MSNFRLAVMLVLVLVVSGCGYYQSTAKVDDARGSRLARHQEQWGNRGHIYGTGEPQPGYPSRRSAETLTRSATGMPLRTQPPSAITLPEEQSFGSQPVFTPQEMPPEPAPLPPPRQEARPRVTEYVVQRGDTLGGISLKVYGTALRWKQILDYNKDVLKSPDKIYPGQKLKIPQD